MAQESVVESLILRRWASGEADKRLSLLTREQGKVYALARGTRKATSKMNSLTEPLSLIRTRLIVGRANIILAQPQPLKAFPRMTMDLERLSSALALCELLDRILPESQPDDALFDFVVDLLTAMERHPYPRALLAWGLWHLLRALGYHPQMEGCMVCSQPVKGKVVALDAGLGGGVCSRCLTHAPKAFRLDEKAWEELGRWLSSAQPPLIFESEDVLLNLACQYAQHHLEGAWRSFDFLKRFDAPRDPV